MTSKGEGAGFPGGQAGGLDPEDGLVEDGGCRGIAGR